MDSTDYSIVCAIAYFSTGIALTGYDFSSPPLHRKIYVLKQNYKIAVMTWFVWPYSSMFEAYQKQKLGRSGFRSLLGVALLAIGMFSWGKLLFIVADRFIGITWVNAISTLIFLVFTSPILTAIAMPRHGG